MAWVSEATTYWRTLRPLSHGYTMAADDKPTMRPGRARLVYPARVALILLVILGWEELLGTRRARLLAVLFLVVQGVDAAVRLHVYHQT